VIKKIENVQTGFQDRPLQPQKNHQNNKREIDVYKSGLCGNFSYMGSGIIFSIFKRREFWRASTALYIIHYGDIWGLYTNRQMV